MLFHDVVGTVSFTVHAFYRHFVTCRWTTLHLERCSWNRKGGNFSGFGGEIAREQYGSQYAWKLFELCAILWRASSSGSRTAYPTSRGLQRAPDLRPSASELLHSRWFGRLRFIPIFPCSTRTVWWTDWEIQACWRIKEDVERCKSKHLKPQQHASQSSF